MISDLIIGTVFWMVGIALLFSLPLFLAENKKRKKIIRSFFSSTFPDIFLLLAYLHLAEYSLNISGEQINLKNGIFLFVVIISLCHSTRYLIHFIRIKFVNKGD